MYVDLRSRASSLWCGVEEVGRFTLLRGFEEEGRFTLLCRLEEGAG